MEAEAEVDNEGGTKLHDLRLSILEKLIQFVPRLSEVGGVRAIPFMQVMLANYGSFKSYFNITIGGYYCVNLTYSNN